MDPFDSSREQLDIRLALSEMGVEVMIVSYDDDDDDDDDDDEITLIWMTLVSMEMMRIIIDDT
jgi:hypothetical protein